ncbi:hypothetical protein DFH09DRAFT_1318072 [Mycena vulgaris]|nr:hypothetical protein DFH09DRAFT_1318072 [Mycena vulgaris]
MPPHAHKSSPDSSATEDDSDTGQAPAPEDAAGHETSPPRKKAKMTQGSPARIAGGTKRLPAAEVEIKFLTEEEYLMRRQRSRLEHEMKYEVIPGSEACWAASADANLSACGAQTGINWHGDLEKYIQYLQSGLDKRKASVLHLFRKWDELFFPESETSLAGKNADDDRAEHAMKDVMDLLDADAEEAPADTQADSP